MKYLRKFNESVEDIDSICKKYGIQNYTINEDGSIDVDGNVDLSFSNLSKLPLKFVRVTGSFVCRFNQLTTLEGCPKQVGGSFTCDNNKLTTLEGCPKEVGGGFYCDDNQITTLLGCPEYVRGNFWCFNNKLTTLEGCPGVVGGNFDCCLNQLTIINSELESVKVRGEFRMSSNPIYRVYKLFPDFESFKYSLDYNYFRYPNQIVKHRFEEACQEAGISLPEKIKGYQYI
jgi:hypothetical protein